VLEKADVRRRGEARARSEPDGASSGRRDSPLPRAHGGGPRRVASHAERVGAYTRLEAHQSPVAGPQVREPINGSIFRRCSRARSSTCAAGCSGSRRAMIRSTSRAMNAADVRRTLAVTTARAYLRSSRRGGSSRRRSPRATTPRGTYDFTRAQLVGGVGNRLDEARAAQELTSDEVLLQEPGGRALSRARGARRARRGRRIGGRGRVELRREGCRLNDALNESAELRGPTCARARQRRGPPIDGANQAYADYLPYLNLIAFPFYQNPGRPHGPADRVAGRARAHDSALRRRFPLRAGARAEGARDEAAPERRGDAAARQEATCAPRSRRCSARTSRSIRRSSPLAFAKKALGLANLAYRAGATTNLEVIDAERQARDAETQAADRGGRRARGEARPPGGDRAIPMIGRTS
jgi:hypothetical protein